MGALVSTNAAEAIESGSWKEIAEEETKDKKGWVVWNGEVLLRQASRKYGKPIALPFGSAVPYNETAAWYQPGGKDHWFELPLALPEIEEEIGLLIPGRLFTTRMPLHLDEPDHIDATDRNRFVKKCKDNQIKKAFVLVEDHEFAEGKSTGLIKFYESECGIKVFHRPIKDFNCPSFEIENASIADLDKALRKGENCLVHCWGGSGRTGTVVIGAMKNLGVTNPIAVARKVKSVYLDIKEQEEFLNKQRTIITQSMANKFPELAENIMFEHIDVLIHAKNGFVTTQGELKAGDKKGYQIIFNKMDLHGTGKVSILEMLAMAHSLRGKEDISAEKLRKLFANIDSSLDGVDPASNSITFEHFLQLVQLNAQIEKDNYEAKAKKEVND